MGAILKGAIKAGVSAVSGKVGWDFGSNLFK